MRHLSLPLIVSALLLSACDMNKTKTVEPRTSYTQESNSKTAAIAAPCTVMQAETAVVTPAKTKIPRTHRVTSATPSDLGPMVQEDGLTDGAIVPEVIIIQAEEERVYPEVDRRTYNERQLSINKGDHTLDNGDYDYGSNYNDTQQSR